MQCLPHLSHTLREYHMFQAPRPLGPPRSRLTNLSAMSMSGFSAVRLRALASKSSKAACLNSCQPSKAAANRRLSDLRHFSRQLAGPFSIYGQGHSRSKKRRADWGKSHVIQEAEGNPALGFHGGKPSAYNLCHLDNGHHSRTGVDLVGVRLPLLFTCRSCACRPRSWTGSAASPAASQRAGPRY